MVANTVVVVTERNRQTNNNNNTAAAVSSVNTTTNNYLLLIFIHDPTQPPHSAPLVTLHSSSIRAGVASVGRAIVFIH